MTLLQRPQKTKVIAAFLLIFILSIGAVSPAYAQLLDFNQFRDDYIRKTGNKVSDDTLLEWTGRQNFDPATLPPPVDETRRTDRQYLLQDLIKESPQSDPVVLQEGLNQYHENVKAGMPASSTRATAADFERLGNERIKAKARVNAESSQNSSMTDEEVVQQKIDENDRQYEYDHQSDDAGIFFGIFIFLVLPSMIAIYSYMKSKNKNTVINFEQNNAKQSNDPGPATPAGTPISKTGTKKCPYCAEEIKADAIKCRFCGEFLNTTVPDSNSKDRSQGVAKETLSNSPSALSRKTPLLRPALIAAIFCFGLGLSSARKSTGVDYGPNFLAISLMSAVFFAILAFLCVFCWQAIKRYLIKDNGTAPAQKPKYNHFKKIESDTDAIMAVKISSWSIIALAGIIFVIHLIAESPWFYMLDAVLFFGLAMAVLHLSSRAAAISLLLLSVPAIFATGYNKFYGGAGGTNILLAFAIAWESVRLIIATFRLNQMRPS